MADAFAPNYSLSTTDNAFSAIWKLTRCMKAAGWNTVAHSDGVTKTAAGTNANDSWGNNANPLLDAYPAFNTAAPWIVMQGPTTLKLLLSGAPTGDFLRGEQVFQGTTGATGEILGIVWDASTASGWAVVQPRTGTFNGTNGVVGQISGYSFIPSSIKTFVREVVFFKATTTVSGTCYYICADQTAESAQLFSTLAASAGATAVIAPGAGGTGNGFPALGITNRGTGGAVTHTTWFGTVSTTWQSHAMVGAVNAVPSVGTSADGSFYLYVAYTSPVGSYTGFMFTRCDDTEPGDVDPYIFFWNNGNSVGTWVRTSATSFSSTQNESWNNIISSSFASFKGYVARDCPVVSRDIATYYFGAYRNTSIGAFFPILNVGQPFPHSIQNHPNAVPPQPRDSFALVTSSVRNTKGTPRWMASASSGNYRDTLDGKKWLCIFPYTNATNPAVYIGPLDGSTTPSS